MSWELRAICESVSARNSQLGTDNSSGLLLRRCLAATGHRPPGPLPHACVGPGALPVDRQIPPVPDPTVAADLHQPLDVEVDLAPQIAFHRVLTVDDLADPVDLFLGQVPHPLVRA